MNPFYSIDRSKKVTRLANKIKEIIGGKIKEDVKARTDLIHKQRFAQGVRLNYEELRKLDDKTKADYIAVIAE